MISDHKQRLKVLFMRDGVICSEEQAVLDHLREDVLPMADEADVGRKLMIRFANRGRITSSDYRTVREFGRDHNCNVIDLDNFRRERHAPDIA